MLTYAYACLRQVPIGWAIDSELSMRFPVIYKHLYATKTPNDFFISGDSGAGYLNPTLLLPDPKTGRRGESNVTKSGAQAWIDWNTHWYHDSRRSRSPQLSSVSVEFLFRRIERVFSERYGNDWGLTYTRDL
jgi:hypothetical protein